MDIKKQGIKIRVTPEQSKKVQEICFELGIYWGDDTYGYIQFGDKPFLYITNGILRWGTRDEYYLQKYNKEVSAEEFIKTKGFTECSICGESKQDCPSEESCSYKIKDTKEEYLTESQIEDLEQLGIDKVGLRKENTEENKQENTPKNNFKEYGFEADFEGKIYEKYEVFDMEFFTGYIWEKPKDDYPNKRLLTWTKEGEPIHYHITEEEQVRIYKINPIKKPWYETPSNFPKIIEGFDDDTVKMLAVVYYYEEGKVYDLYNKPYRIKGITNWKLATKDSVLSLLVEGEENE